MSRAPRMEGAAVVSRRAVQRFLNAADEREIIFTGSSTNAINLVAHSYGRGVMKPGQADPKWGVERSMIGPR